MLHIFLSHASWVAPEIPMLLCRSLTLNQTRGMETFFGERVTLNMGVQDTGHGILQPLHCYSFSL